MRIRQLNSTNYPIKLLLVSSSDSKTGIEGETPVIKLNKNDSTTFTLASGNVVEVGNGIYNFIGHAHDRNTLGELVIHASGANCDPLDEKYTIVNYDPFSHTSDDSNANLTDDDIHTLS